MQAKLLYAMRTPAVACGQTCLRAQKYRFLGQHARLRGARQLERLIGRPNVQSGDESEMRPIKVGAILN